MNHDLKLYSISPSHFCEKVRWALDFKGLPYKEIAWVPVLHFAAVRKLKVPKTSVPILQSHQETIQDSFKIIQWLEEYHPTPALMPQKGLPRNRVLELDKKFNKIGEHLRRVVYWNLLSDRKASIQALGNDVKGWQNSILPWVFPLVKMTIYKALNIHEKSYQRSMDQVKTGLDELEQLLAGSNYLLENRFTAADLSAASLLAPLVLPPEHPIYSKLNIPENFFTEIASIRNHPSLHWVEQIYRTQRMASPVAK